MLLNHIVQYLDNFHTNLKISLIIIVILQRGVLGKVEQYYVKKEYQMRGAPHYHILLWIENAPVVGIDCPEDVSSFIQDSVIYLIVIHRQI